MSYPNDKRKDFNTYYLDIAKMVASRGTCRRRNYGAVIVKNNEIIATGYTGSPNGCINCATGDDYCTRELQNIPSGQNYEICRSIHAEMNAMLTPARKDMIDSTLYLVGLNKDGKEIDASSCTMCKKHMIRAGIEKVVTRDNAEYVSSYIKEIDNIGL